MRLLYLAIFLVLILACSKQDDTSNKGEDCFPELIVGLKIDVRNSETNKFVDSGIIVKARDGAYEEILRLGISSQPMADTSYLSNNRIGTYIITIRGDDYELFTSSPVKVLQDMNGCNNNVTTSKTFKITPKIK